MFLHEEDFLGWERNGVLGVELHQKLRTVLSEEYSCPYNYLVLLFGANHADTAATPFSSSKLCNSGGRT